MTKTNQMICTIEHKGITIKYNQSTAPAPFSLHILPLGNDPTKAITKGRKNTTKFAIKT